MGDSIQYAAVAVFDDGRREPVDAAWVTGDSTVATVGTDGWAIARSLGATTVEARVDGATGPGTFIANTDIVPPALVDAFVQPDRVNVFQRAGTVRFVVDFEDQSGTKSALAVFSGPQGAGISGLVAMTEVVDSTRAPDPSRTRFEGLLEIPGTVGAGTWRLSTLRADDDVGNVAQWGGQALIERGFDLVVVAVLTGGHP